MFPLNDMTIKKQFYNDKFSWCNQYIQLEQNKMHPPPVNYVKATLCVIYRAPGKTDRKHKRGSVSSVKMSVSVKDCNTTWVFKEKICFWWHNSFSYHYNTSYCTFGSISKGCSFVLYASIFPRGFLAVLLRRLRTWDFLKDFQVYV